MNIAQITSSIRPLRKPRGIVAALLPFEKDGTIAVDAFQNNLRQVHAAGLMNAVNMDTGYVNYLSDAQIQDVLQWTVEALGSGVSFVAGAYIEGREGSIDSLYRAQMQRIAAAGGIPIIFQSRRAHGQEWREKVELYCQISRDFPDVLAFELGQMFSASGQIFDEPTFRGLMDVPQIKGIKHSSLDRKIELQRLMLRDQVRPDFRIYSGNDLGINMIEYGSDYLLGLACLAPRQFARRDQLWESGDAEYYELSDALQFLGNLVFRPPVPAYKHSAAIFLHLIGQIPSPNPHPQNPTRPNWEGQILADAARRLGLLA